MMGRLLTRELSMGVALLGIWAFFAWREPVFLSERNLSLLSSEGMARRTAELEGKD